MWQGRRRWRARRPPLDEASLLRIRFAIFRGVILFFFFILTAQLWRLQIVEASYYKYRAENNRLRVLPLAPLRGVIYDRHGNLLVRNVPSFAIAIIPADVPLGEQAALAQRLGHLIDVPPQDIEALVNGQRAERRLFSPVTIKADVPQELAFVVDEHHTELPGVVLLTEPKRHYLEGDTAAHVLGYVGPLSPADYARLRERGYQMRDKTGKMGVELFYEQELRGRPGQETVEVDVFGRKTQSLEVQEAQAGQNLVLSLDIELQRAMARFLADGMEEARYAAAAAVNPKTGEILGLVSLPSFDPNIFSTPQRQKEAVALLTDSRRPLLNYALGAAQPPGSTFKMVVASAALEEGVATPKTRIVSTGAIAIVSPYDPSAVTIMRDWAALGSLDLYQGIAQSSDVYFYYLAGGYEDFQGLGIERLATYARAFGLGAPTNIDLPSEASGLVPDPTWKKAQYGEPWYLGDTYNLGIGQGYLLTSPLQMLMATAAIANGGTLYQPQVVREVVDNSGRVLFPFEKKVRRQLPVRPEHLAVVREGMRQAVAQGAAWRAQVPGIEVAGKTGTAEFVAQDPVLGRRFSTHGWFVAFAPFDDPQIAVVVFQEHGNGAGTAAPVAGKILRFYFEREAQLQGKSLPPTGEVRSGA